MLTSSTAPSSGPSGHLLPTGEKGLGATSCGWQLRTTAMRRGALRGLFSPTGRRWPEGPDEGGWVLSDSDITKRGPGKTSKARYLRRQETEEESFLWSDLRGRRLNGFKFSRQIPLGPYIVDFLCREQYLVVEVDGFQHAESKLDRVRTTWLNRQGYSVLRFWNHEITHERRAVLDTILAALTGRMVEHCEVARFFPSLALGHDKTGEFS
ncbi:DUF559 domain-containing protein [Corticibacterium sp. UT-5YL-CI-8]|nr:DUF559 domain-containing protein [Tianweitania sp. UT-5YL-CI-8]